MLHLTKFQEALNNSALKEALELLPWVLGDTYIRESLYKIRVAFLYNRSVREQPIKISDIMLRQTRVIAKLSEHGKLSANWEGPYATTNETYLLVTL